MNSYPTDLVPVIKKACSARRRQKYHRPPPLPADTVLATLLDVSYHASFEAEEGRRLGFRLILYSLDDHKMLSEHRWGDSKYYEQCSRLILLDSERPFDVAEVKRLAPAAELKRLLICVKSKEPHRAAPTLHIWALLDVGENWWKFVHHETGGGMPPPNFLTISCTGPGEMSISAQGDVLASL